MPLQPKERLGPYEILAIDQAIRFFLKAERAWDVIPDDPRFARLVRQVGIP